MKNLLLASALILSLTTIAQTAHSDQLNSSLYDAMTIEALIENLPTQIVIEEDETFEFDTKAYLPLGFDPYSKGIYDQIEEISIEGEEVPFEFNTEDYLPLGFNPYNENLYKDLIEVPVDETIEPLDFDHYKYLPKGFNPFRGIVNYEDCIL